MAITDIFQKLRGKKPEGARFAKLLSGSVPTFSSFGTDIYRDVTVEQAVSCIVREMMKVDPQHIRTEGSDVIPVHDSIQYVLENPNEHMTQADFIGRCVWTYYKTDNVFIYPVWDANGINLKAMYPLAPTRVDFIEDAHNKLYVKFYFSNGYEGIIPYDKVIHIKRNYNSNEYMGGSADGQPNNGPLLGALQLNHTLNESVAKSLKASLAINAIVKFNTLMDEGKTQDAMDRLTQFLQNNESGLMPLDLKNEFIPLERKTAVVNTDTLKFMDEKILRHFGVPLAILSGDYTKAQYEAFYQSTLEPLIRQFSQAFTKVLFSEREAFGYGHRVVFYPKDLIFMSIDQKLEMMRILGDAGGLYLNEMRTMMGKKPLPELVGVRKVSLNYVDADIASKYQLGIYGGETDTSPEDESEAQPEKEGEKE